MVEAGDVAEQAPHRLCFKGTIQDLREGESPLGQTTSPANSAVR